MAELARGPSPARPEGRDQWPTTRLIPVHNAVYGPGWQSPSMSSPRTFLPYQVPVMVARTAVPGLSAPAPGPWLGGGVAPGASRPPRWRPSARGPLGPAGIGGPPPKYLASRRRVIFTDLLALWPYGLPRLVAAILP